MTLNEYQHLAQRTSGPGHDRLLNGCLGLIGESGEIVDITGLLGGYNIHWAFASGAMVAKALRRA